MFRTATLISFIIYAAAGSLFWLQLTIALNVAAGAMGLLAATPASSTP